MIELCSAITKRETGARARAGGKHLRPLSDTV